MLKESKGEIICGGKCDRSTRRFQVTVVKLNSLKDLHEQEVSKSTNIRFIVF